MTKPLRISKEAELEILDAYLWYESNSTGLGKKFRAELSKQFQQIKNFPSLFPIHKRNEQFPIQKCVLKVFPFIIFYSNSEKSVDVIAVFHSSRKPKY